MKRTIYKLFWAWNFEKEEEWINKMSAEGWQLDSVQVLRYVFTKGDPDEYVYRLELLENVPFHSESKKYLQFLEETGVECIGSYMRWVYLRKNKAYGEFELFSDIDSKIKHYKRLFTLFIAIMLLNVPSGISNMTMVLSTKNVANLVLGFLNSFIGVVCIYVCIIWAKKIKKLEREKLIRE